MKIPVNVLTGFLGSGKTTLLSQILREPEFAGCAVLINEFGEVGLDHQLVQAVEGDVVLLPSGCICCTIRGDLAASIRSLYERREAGLLPPFNRLIVETTGLADPTPILATLMQDPVLRHHFRLGNVITTVDAVNGTEQLRRQPESVKQAAVADRILITKTDLATKAAISGLEATLRRLNPSALIRHREATIDAAALIGQDSFDPATKSAEVAAWLSPFACEPVEPRGGLAGDPNRHDDRIHAFAMVFDAPMDWTVFGAWLTLLLGAHGDDILRVKGLLNVAGVSAPVAVHGVQRLVHPPLHLDAWPDQDRRSKLVFIVRDIERGRIERSFQVFQDTLARQPIAA